jgi:hypothetical protein
MAAITAALIGGTALTATTIGAGAAMLGAGASIAGGISNLSAASKANGLAAQARQDAAQAMEEARKANSVNNYAALGINKDLYNQYTEAALSTAAQGIQAVQQGDQRGAAAGAGQISNAMNQNLAQIRSAENTDIINNQHLVAQDNARRQAAEMNMDLGIAQGSANAARNYQMQSTALNASGVNQIANGLISAAPSVVKSLGPQDKIGVGAPPTTAPAGTVISPTIAGASSANVQPSNMAGVTSATDLTPSSMYQNPNPNATMYDINGYSQNAGIEPNPGTTFYTLAQLQQMGITPR